MPKLSKDAQILELQADLQKYKDGNLACQEEISKLNKSLADSKRAADSVSVRLNDFAGEIGQIHALLDVLPNAIPRKIVSENGYSDVAVNAMTRLAAWLTVNVK